MAWCQQATSHFLSQCVDSDLYHHMASLCHSELMIDLTVFFSCRSQRLQFDVSSPNGILLFREVSKVIVGYGKCTRQDKAQSASCKPANIFLFSQIKSAHKVNPLHAELIWGNIKKYLHLLPFYDSERLQVVEIHSQGWQEGRSHYHGWCAGARLLTRFNLNPCMDK